MNEEGKDELLPGAVLIAYGKLCRAQNEKAELSERLKELDASIRIYRGVTLDFCERCPKSKLVMGIERKLRSDAGPKD